MNINLFIKIANISWYENDKNIAYLWEFEEKLGDNHDFDLDIPTIVYALTLDRLLELTGPGVVVVEVELLFVGHRVIVRQF